MRQRLLSFVAALFVSVGGFAASAQAENPYTKPDASFISLTGSVVNPRSDSFKLDYGSAMVTVEMDDWDSYGDAYILSEGDQVTVYGVVDDDFFETTKIEASSIYIDDLNSYFYASPADEEDVVSWNVDLPLAAAKATVIGKVATVNKYEGQFTIETGATDLTVETDLMGYNPLDNFGFQQIDAGDRVSVTGFMDENFIAGRVFKADSVITVQEDAGTSG